MHLFPEQGFPHISQMNTWTLYCPSTRKTSIYLHFSATRLATGVGICCRSTLVWFLHFLQLFIFATIIMEYEIHGSLTAVGKRGSSDSVQTRNLPTLPPVQWQLWRLFPVFCNRFISPQPCLISTKILRTCLSYPAWDDQQCGVQGAVGNWTGCRGQVRVEWSVVQTRRFLVQEMYAFGQSDLSCTGVCMYVLCVQE